MAIFHTEFLSKELGVVTNVTVFLPIDDIWQPAEHKGPYKVLYLLHGAWSNHTEWLYRSNVINYAQKHNLAVVMPGINNTCYTDPVEGSFKSYSYVSKELPEFIKSVFPISDKVEDTYIAGLSMGGYGALKIALSNPTQYRAVASLSGAVNIETLSNGDFTMGIFPKVVKDTIHDLQYLVKTNHPQLPIFQCCGTEDFLYQDNIAFKEFMEKEAFNYQYHEGVGGHDWVFWNTWIETVIDWMMNLD